VGPAFENGQWPLVMVMGSCSALILCLAQLMQTACAGRPLCAGFLILCMAPCDGKRSLARVALCSRYAVLYPAVSGPLLPAVRR
jgi:hypothetical protein